jgi:ribosomal protein S8E
LKKANDFSAESTRQLLAFLVDGLFNFLKRDRKSNGTLDGLYRERRRVLDEREKKERSLSEGRDRARLVFGNVKRKKPLKKVDRSKSLHRPLILRGL